MSEIFDEFRSFEGATRKLSRELDSSHTQQALKTLRHATIKKARKLFDEMTYEEGRKQDYSGASFSAS